ncbi:hypothetical protein D3C76_1518740 [compost metagenome]
MCSERVNKGRVRVRHHYHVGFFNSPEASDGGTVESNTSFEGFSLNLYSGNRQVMGFAANVSKPKINPFNTLFLNGIQHFLNRHG